jgi:hypothetical protein
MKSVCTVLATLCLGAVICLAANAQGPATADSVTSGSRPGAAIDPRQPARPAKAAPVDEKVLLDETVDRGVLYLFGNRMDPPYRIVVVRDTLWVNGIQASPGPGAEPKRLAPEVQARRSSILREITQEFELRGHFREADLQPLLSRIAASHPADVERLSVEGGRLVVYWRGSAAPESFTPGGGAVLLPMEPVSPLWVRATLVKQAEGFVAELKSGGAVFVGNGVHSGPLGPVGRDLSYLSGIDRKDLAARWSGRTLPLQVAEDLLDPLPLARLARRLR